MNKNIEELISRIEHYPSSCQYPGSREKSLDFILSRAQREDAQPESRADSPSETPDEGTSEQK
jgi:hypothetical protein